jgi:hypothetical protein
MAEVQHHFSVHQERKVSLTTAQGLMAAFLERNEAKMSAGDEPMAQEDRLNALTDDAVEKINKVLSSLKDQLGNGADDGTDDAWAKKPLLAPAAKGKGKGKVSTPSSSSSSAGKRRRSDSTGSTGSGGGSRSVAKSAAKKLRGERGSSASHSEEGGGRGASVKKEKKSKSPKDRGTKSKSKK